MKTFKRIFACMLAVLMCVCVIPMGEVGMTASAASHTVTEAMNWCNGLVNTKVGSGQCVALIQAYYQYLGASKSSGNACDYATNAVPSGWSRVKGGVPQAGDILVYTGAKYGHVAIYAGGTTSYHQNMAGLYVEKKTNWAYNKSWFSQAENGTKSYWGYIRPNFSNAPTNPNAPTINGVCMGLITNETFRPCCMVGGDVPIAAVKVAVWSREDQSDLIWYGTVNNGENTFFNDIKYSDHAAGATHFYCDFYVDGTNGKSSSMRLEYWVDTEKPTISNVQVSKNVTGYSVTCNVSDNVGVTRVRFPSWTDTNGQDDLIWHEGTINGNTATCWIPVSAHNNEYGYYATHIYAYDAMGNESQYALFFEVSPKTTITFNPVGGIISGKAENRNYTLEYKTGMYGDVSWLSPSKTGHTFTGWYTDVNGGKMIYSANGKSVNDGEHWKDGVSVFPFDYAVYAHWTANSYTVTFNANSGSCSTKNKTVTYNSTYGTLPTPTRTGYTFDGWYTAATGGTKITSSTKVTATSNQTLYAHWSHAHSYTSTVTKAATCTQTGTKTFKCSICGNTYTESIPATGHKAVTDKAIAATCTSEGKTEGSHCSVCGTAIKAQTTVAKLEHKYTATVNQPDCTKEGEKVYTCSVCGDTYTEMIPPMLNHTDANNDGKCDICGKDADIASIDPITPDTCDHLCHKSGFVGFIYKLILPLWKLFKINKTCSCGAAHY
ncbi:MAG: GBS Bsp-like repeat-containing protein [Faecalibacterium sp.]|nr:GBS Bsp-like repeat-containing protein [Ruminococcus sp.]MCM1392446.1 GBS Bsp-like repeat-containing protein [Ruminococcus sp.]MCM1486181.1 GBS Bsp-like repeat-containing protein [Faecalibacterium sp.]